MRLTKESTQVLRALAEHPGEMRPVREWLGVLPFDAPTLVQAVAELGGARPPLVAGCNVGEEGKEVHIVGITDEGVRRAREDGDPGVA